MLFEMDLVNVTYDFDLTPPGYLVFIRTTIPLLYIFQNSFRSLFAFCLTKQSTCILSNHSSIPGGNDRQMYTHR